MSGASPAQGRSLQVLVISADPLLVEEIDEALAGAAAMRAALRSAPDHDSGLELTRGRAPDLVFVELGKDPHALRGLAERLRALAPEALVAGVQRAGESADPAIWIEALRARFEDVVQRPASSGQLRPLVERILDSWQGSDRAEGVVIAFHSTKGGVGKSSLSVNTACGLALRHPGRVLLVDASLQLGVCSVALDLDAPSTLADCARERDRLDETLLRQLAPAHESGVHVLAAPHDAVEASEVDEEAIARVVTLARRAFDFVVIDTQPIVDGVLLTILDLADRVYLVNQGTVPDVIGAAHLFEVLDGVGLGPGRRRVVLNRNTPRFPGSLTVAEVSDRIGQPVDHEVPYDKRVFTGLNLGVPHVLRARRRFGWGRALAALVAEVEALRDVAPSQRRSAEEP